MLLFHLVIKVSYVSPPTSQYGKEIRWQVRAGFRIQSKEHYFSQKSLGLVSNTSCFLSVLLKKFELPRWQTSFKKCVWKEVAGIVMRQVWPVQQINILKRYQALQLCAKIFCFSGAQWQSALELFYAMPRMGLTADAITYSSVISALSKGKQWRQALTVSSYCL